MKISLLGMPRIGAARELKTALEGFWNGKITAQQLENTGAELRQENLQLLQKLNFDYIPCNDFSYYDRMLDLMLMLGIVPERFAVPELPNGSPKQYFAMARGTVIDGQNIPALEMTKWFNTNYHYLVPELPPPIEFQPRPELLIQQIREAVALGIKPAPVLIGPVTFLMLSHLPDGINPAAYFPALTEAYDRIVRALAAEEITAVNFEEPALVLDECTPLLPGLRDFFTTLRNSTPTELFVHTFFDSLHENYSAVINLPVHGFGLDFVNGIDNLASFKQYGFPHDKVLFAGVIDGRNIWRADAFRIDEVIRVVKEKLSLNKLVLTTSCPLLHCPVSLAAETGLPEEHRRYLAFAREKVEELAELRHIYHEGRPEALDALKQLRRAFFNDTSRYCGDVRERCLHADALRGKRSEPFAQRSAAQQRLLQLPPLPTTTIGSFPQTAELRRFRKACRDGKISVSEYENGIRQRIADVIKLQEEIGLDVLVHGEFERNDMVEFFGERLDGYLFTANGWVQSYGSRCVKPPIIFGDIHRPDTMSVDEIVYAQSLTDKPVKGMLTGPVTMLNWSFVRDDLPRQEVCFQLAMAIREEVLDLERNGIKIIQVDEPALREGLPLHREQRPIYLKWAVECFRTTVSSVSPATQIHTHMCYSNFNEIIDEIIAMDPDVISMENSRSGNDLLQIFRTRQYPNQIGPGVYDIHSPNVPTQEELQAEITRLLQVFPVEKLWINPDCGLKTRKDEEVIPSLKNMVAAARSFRPA